MSFWTSTPSTLGLLRFAIAFLLLRGSSPGKTLLPPEISSAFKHEINEKCKDTKGNGKNSLLLYSTITQQGRT